MLLSTDYWRTSLLFCKDLTAIRLFISTRFEVLSIIMPHLIWVVPLAHYGFVLVWLIENIFCLYVSLRATQILIRWRNNVDHKTCSEYVCY